MASLPLKVLITLLMVLPASLSRPPSTTLPPSTTPFPAIRRDHPSKSTRLHTPDHRPHSKAPFFFYPPVMPLRFLPTRAFIRGNVGSIPPSGSGEFRSRRSHSQVSSPVPIPMMMFPSTNGQQASYPPFYSQDSTDSDPKVSSSPSPSSKDPSLDLKEFTELKDQFLDIVDDYSRLQCINRGHQGSLFLPPQVEPIEDMTSSQWKSLYRGTSIRVALLSSILSNYQPETDGYKLMRNSLDQLVQLDPNFFRVRVAWIVNHASPNGSSSSKEEIVADYFNFLERKRRLSTESYNHSIPLSSPWLNLPSDGQKKNQYMDTMLKEGSVRVSTSAFARDELTFAKWTPVYYSCELRKWLLSYTSFIVSHSQSGPGSNRFELKGFVSVDFDISNTDFDQCGSSEVDVALGAIPLSATHKCDPQSSQCVFNPGFGWKRGGYTCMCKEGFYSTVTRNENHARHSFNGSMVEAAWKLKSQRRGFAYDMIYTCRKCPDGCDNCTDGTPCTSSTTNWIFRISLMLVSIVCTALTLLLIYYAYRY